MLHEYYVTPPTERELEALKQLETDRLVVAPNGVTVYEKTGRSVPRRVLDNLLRRDWVNRSSLPLFGQPEDGCLTRRGRATLQRYR